MLLAYLTLLLLSYTAAVPVPQESAFIGKGTCQLAQALLERHPQDENVVFSPLGTNTLLAIFAEGARGATRDEIASSLHFPADIQAVRKGYQAVLRRLSEKYKPNSPEMKNWFYIYKNYTVDDDLKNVLREYYLTEVKSVNRPEDYLDASDDEQKTKVKVPSGLQGKPTDHLIDVDKEVESIIGGSSIPHKSDGEEAASSHQPSLFDPAKEGEKRKEDVVEPQKVDAIDQSKLEGSNVDVVAAENPSADVDEKKTEESEAEKMPEVPKPEPEKNAEDEKVLVPPPQEAPLAEEVKNIPIDEKKETVKLPGSSNSNEKVHLSEKEKEELKTEDVKTPVAEVLPSKEEVLVKEEGEKKEDNEIIDSDKIKKEEEIMVAMQRSLDSVDDMHGMTDSAVKIKGKGSKSQMVVFNGLYFQGDWNTQFVKNKADDSRPFYKSNGEKIFVNTLHAEGLFNTADLPELKTRALELKYSGDRYSLLLLVPHEKDGLEDLVNKLSSVEDYPFSRIYEKLDEKLLDICLPTFQVTTISKPVTSDKSNLLYVSSIFNPEKADLSGISREPGLYVEELVQLVTFQVDSNYTEANFLTASVASSRSDMEKVRVNQPFLFYLRDNVDGIVLVNGKVVDPTPPHDDFTTKSLRNTLRNAVE